MNFSSFLRLTKTASAEACRKVFVLGNEAGDLDSIICSMSLAYLEQLKSESIKYIPLLNIPRDDLSLRGEVCWAFDHFGLDRMDLVFINDLDLEKEMSQFILVDHNALSASQLFLQDRIIGIYDHHKDENQFLDVRPRIVEPVGSCCSLIVSEWISSGFIINLSNDVSSLMLSAILIDTVNLQESYGRTTSKDKEAAEYLMKTLNLSHEMANNFFHQLQKAKNDLMKMSSWDLIRKDHKKWIMEGLSVGISSVTLSISDWKMRELQEGRGDWILELERFTNENCMDITCLMTAYTKNDVFCRELLVYFNSNKVSPKKVIHSLMKSDLQLEIIDKDEKWWHFKQTNIKCSRKQVQPLLSTILKDIFLQRL